MNPNGITAELRTELEALLVPVRERVTAIDLLIAEREAELKDLRAARRDAVKIIGVLDPRPAPAKQKTSPNGKVIATATLERVAEWLRAHADELNAGGFSAPSLLEEHGFDLVSRATTNHALTALHADGRIRLDRRGRGGAKFYKVVT